MFSSNTSQVSSDATYIEDVFSTWLYDGNGSTQTITNGIDLAGKGGLVWIKDRTSGTANHAWFDTARGSPNMIRSDRTDAQVNATNEFGSFTSTGFTVPVNTIYGFTNFSTDNFASWTFRKQPKFFDVVTYTGNGVPGRQIPHNLGTTPGCIIVKNTSSSASWQVWHRSMNTGGGAGNAYILLNSTQQGLTDNGSVWGNVNTSTYIAPTATAFTVSGIGGEANANGAQYVAYLFAHNAGGFGLTGTDNVISCGSFTTDGSTNAFVELGYEPQWVMIKNIQNTGDWFMYDNMRGWSQTTNSGLRANLSNAEFTSSNNYRYTYATGFKWGGDFASNNYIYIAIRRGPMKVPTDGTKVFAAQATAAATNGTPTTNRFTSNFPVDLLIQGYRDGNGSTAAQFVVDRLRGSSPWISTSTTGSENANTTFQFASQTGLYTSSALGAFNACGWMWQRAPGFFDEVCYTGNPGNPAVTHNLTVVPELILLKARSTTSNWGVGASIGGGNGIVLASASGNFDVNTNGGTVQVITWAGYAATSTTFDSSVIGAGYESYYNSGTTYVAYLFATCPGVSKVGTYTGNGATQTINCGFTGGARFVLIKRTDSTGDWYVWDTARGIVSANDPRLSLNSTSAEVTTDDSIDPDNSGFIVNQVSATNINVSSATYIYLAIA